MPLENQTSLTHPPSDYTGRYCESKVLFCKETDYCLNGGVCVVVEEHLVSNSSKVRYEKNVCYCQPSFYGDRCEFHYAKCLSSMLICENNGTCIDSDDPNEPFRCSCTEEFRGGWLSLVKSYLGTTEKFPSIGRT